MNETKETVKFRELSIGESFRFDSAHQWTLELAKLATEEAMHNGLAAI